MQTSPLRSTPNGWSSSTCGRLGAGRVAWWRRSWRSSPSEFAAGLKVVKVNVDESPMTAQRHQARSIPMLLFMRDGDVVETVVGAQPEHVLRARIEALG